jgi:hypothetical protein
MLRTISDLIDSKIYYTCFTNAVSFSNSSRAVLFFSSFLSYVVFTIALLSATSELSTTHKPPHLPNSVTPTPLSLSDNTQVELKAIKMHNSLNEQEVSIESRDVVETLWTLLPSRINCTFLQLFT